MTLVLANVAVRLAKRLIHYPDKLNWVCCDLDKTTRPPNAYFHPNVWLPVDKVPLGVMQGIEVSDVQLDRSQPNQMHAATIVEPDTVLTGEKGRIGWHYQRIAL